MLTFLDWQMSAIIQNPHIRMDEIVDFMHVRVQFESRDELVYFRCSHCGMIQSRDGKLNSAHPFAALLCYGCTESVYNCDIVLDYDGPYICKHGVVHRDDTVCRKCLRHAMTSED